MFKMIKKSREITYYLATLIFALNISALNGPLLAWSYTDLIVKENQEIQAPESLTPEQIKQDLDFLWYAMDRGYGGRNYLPKGDMDLFAKALKDYANKTKSVQRTLDFCDFIGQLLWNLPDNHLSIRKDESKKCGQASQSKQVNNGIGKNLAAVQFEKKGVPWTWQIETVGESKVGILAIKQFVFSEDKVWNGFDEVRTSTLTMDALIIDLRGNGGGDDTQGFNLAQTLLGHDVGAGWDKTHKRQTPETITLLQNIFRLSKNRTKPDDIEKRAYLDERIQKEGEKLQAAIAQKLPEEEVIDTQKPIASGLSKASFNKPIYILVDRGCASSCESSLEALASHPLAKIIGQNTGGYFHFGNVGGTYLPNSRLRISIPTKYNAYNDGRSYEKVGFQPHVKVSDGTDALLRAKTLVRSYFAAKRKFAQVTNHK